MEQRQRQLIVKALNKLKLHAISVENPACPGTPDVAYIQGWVELKYVEKWPAHVYTALRLPHFTPQQRVWLLEDWTSGGNCWLCLQVSKPRDWLVFSGEVAAKCLGRSGYGQHNLMGLADMVTDSAENVANFLKEQNK